MQQDRISLFRIDFSAKIRDNDGTEHLVMIELQKTWFATETLRFRQYLATQYVSKNNMCSDNNFSYGLPIISIYILGHILGDLKEPIVYVRCRSMEVEDEILSEIESRNTLIMQKNQMLEEKDQMLEEKDQVIEQLLMQKTEMLQEMVSTLTRAGISVKDIAVKLSIP